MIPSIFNRYSPLFVGLYLGFILAGITFIGLMVLCPPPTNNGYSISITDSVTPDSARKIFADALAKCHRYLGREGVNLIWGYDPKPDFHQDVILPFGFVLVPIFILGITTLVYVAVVRCRYLFSAYSPPNTSPAPSETFETTPR